MPKSSRGIGQTPWSASLAPSSEAVSLEDMGSIRDDTAYTLKVEGTPLNEKVSFNDKYHKEGIISRVAVWAPDGEPLMATKPSRARKWIESGKAIPIRTKLGIFGVKLKEEPSGRAKQPIVLGIDPGSKFTGMAVASKEGILCGFNLELPDDKKPRMDTRRKLRNTRRQKKKWKRECRFLNRRGCKLPPSIKARKLEELRVAKELFKTYPISEIAMENVAFDHRNKRYGSYFSHAEVGKNWLREELEKMAPVELFQGSQTSKRRIEIGLEKSSKKSVRNPTAHVNDAISLCSLLIGEIKQTPFHFDIIKRPKYSRRKLHDEQLAKGGAKRRYGGTTTPYIFRKGDYVEATIGKTTIRGWVSGYTEKRKLVSVSNFDWERIRQFSVSKVRLLERNTGLLLKSKGGLIYE